VILSAGARKCGDSYHNYLSGFPILQNLAASGLAAVVSISDFLKRCALSMGIAVNATKHHHLENFGTAVESVTQDLDVVSLTIE